MHWENKQKNRPKCQIPQAVHGIAGTAQIHQLLLRPIEVIFVDQNTTINHK